ncbi:IS256 family transposase [candidate division WOR-3 bacterium]|nr:IS256 family transposase [candidate division WOR-3 bacterium]
MAQHDTYGELVGQLPVEWRGSLDDLAREGARRMLAAALEAEVADYVGKHRSERDADGHSLVVRNGKARPRTLATGAGAIRVTAPRVNDRREGKQFTSEILPPYMRRSPRLEEALPVLYLRGLSTSDFAPALEVLFGEAVRGFSATTITRLKEVWEAEYNHWAKRDLAGRRYAYVWADGVNFPIRLESDRLTCLVLVGVTEQGEKEVIALVDGYRESEESWASLLRDLKRRGMRAPRLAVGDGALGFWKALDEVYPGVGHQLCWKHKVANVLDKLPKRLQAAAKDRLHAIMYAPDRDTARKELKVFREEYEAKYPKAVASLASHEEDLLRFLDYPAEHWVHLRTTNPIESGFGTVKARTKKTRGSGSRKAGLAMAFKLIQAAEQRWRRINAPQLVAAVLAGIEFKDGARIGQTSPEQPDPSTKTTDGVAA